MHRSCNHEMASQVHVQSTSLMQHPAMHDYMASPMLHNQCRCSTQSRMLDCLEGLGSRVWIVHYVSNRCCGIPSRMLHSPPNLGLPPCSLVPDRGEGDSHVKLDIRVPLLGLSYD
jgi:hypothetical protein